MSRRSAVRPRIGAIDPNMSLNYSLARMAEWSKAVDLRPTIIRCEGSNPSSRISYIHIYIFFFDDIYFNYLCLPCLPTALSADGLLKHTHFILKNIQFYFVY
jgi:hypothetical protein